MKRTRAFRGHFLQGRQSSPDIVRVYIPHLQFILLL